MKVVRKEDVAKVGAERKRVREGTLDIIRLAQGTPGTADNYMYALSTTQSDYRTPRHRHNFEQIRLQLRGEWDYERDGTMTPGTVGYFPEGGYYGPSHSSDDATILILQFGGASGCGYMSHDEYAEAMAVLAGRGKFHEGIYTWNDAAGKKHNKDGYEAVWEESRQRELHYPRPRYDRPVMMRPEHFTWRPSRDEAGVSFKALGTFSERDVRIGFVRIDAGAATRQLPGNTLYFVMSGTGSAAGESWLAESALILGKGESAEVRAAEAAELFYIGLPDLEGIEFAAHQKRKAEAGSPA
jgi:hypothetical protein